MWRCPNCGEHHDDQFDSCWKCGTGSAGDSNPDFRVSEPATEQDQSPDSQMAELQPPTLRLPSITYFSIAAYPWIYLALFIGNPKLFFRQISPMSPEFHISPTEIIFSAFAFLLIGLPVAAKMVHAWYLDFMRKYTFSDGWFGMTWMLSMFLLPDSLRCSHRWFVPVYYVSLVAWFVVPPVIGVLQIINAG